MQGWIAGPPYKSYINCLLKSLNQCLIKLSGRSAEWLADNVQYVKTKMHHFNCLIIFMLLSIMWLVLNHTSWWRAAAFEAKWLVIKGLCHVITLPTPFYLYSIFKLILPLCSSSLATGEAALATDLGKKNLLGYMSSRIGIYFFDNIL